MQKMNTSTLTFNNVELKTINHENQIWMTSVELAKALGYERADSVSRIYDRNKDEFSSKMSKLVDRQIDGLGEFSGLQGKTRIFSLRGCHLIAMFAKTAIAKLFRVWVLDILDKETNQPAYGLKDDPINTAPKLNEWQKQYIRECVAEKAYRESRTRQAIYWDLSKEFFVNSYHELHEQEFEAVALWLGFPWLNLTPKTIALTAERFGELCIFEEENKQLRKAINSLMTNQILGKQEVEPIAAKFYHAPSIQAAIEVMLDGLELLDDKADKIQDAARAVLDGIKLLDDAVVAAKPSA